MNKRVAAILILVSLIASSFLALHSVNLARANFTPLPTLPPPIYILSNGSIDPPTAPIHRVGDTPTR